MNSCSINSNSLLGRDVRSILQVIMLTLLLCLQIQPGQSSQILLANCLIDCGSSSNSLAIVMSSICPPIGLHLDITQDHVLNGNRQSGNFPWNICLPASPSLRQMLQNGPSFVLFDSLGHHVYNIVHNGSTQLKIKVRLHTLLGDGFCDAL